MRLDEIARSGEIEWDRVRLGEIEVGFCEIGD